MCWRTVHVHSFIASKFLGDRRQCVRLDGKVSELVDVVSGCPKVVL